MERNSKKSYLPHLKERIQKSSDPLYTALQVSVAGNIIDMGIFKDFELLAEQLVASGVKVTYVVKESPILNDATQEDADYVGMRDVAYVMSNGSGFLGTVIKDCSEEFRAAFEEADLVISKGQANYESLESTREAGVKTYFLLRAKCEVVAKSLEVQLGKMVFCDSNDA